MATAGYAAKSGAPHRRGSAPTARLQPDGARGRRGQSSGGMAPGPLALAAPAFRLSAAGAAPGPAIQRQILLVDRDERYYEEQDSKGPAYGKGPLYYTGMKPMDKPIFTLAGPVDQFMDELGLTADDLSDTDYTRLRNSVYRGEGATKLATAYAGWTFYTDAADVTETLGDVTREGAAQTVLSLPLLADPNRKGGGFANRFPQPVKGMLASKLTAEETVKQLGKLPEGVKLYAEVNDSLFKQVARTAVYREDVTADFAYFRGVGSPELNPRDESSKFKTRESVDTADDKEALTAMADLDESEVPAANGNTDETIEYKGYARKKSRGKGQEHAMSGWNALGYAAYCLVRKKIGVNLKQDWEWLHIRGAQNGGPTTAANLVAGTSTTNSRMIPWEDRINRWTYYARSDRPLKVRYKGTRYSGTNLGGEIRFFISAPRGLPGAFTQAIPDSSPVEVAFDPIQGNVFDRMSERLTRKAAIPERVKEEAESVAEEGDE